MARLNPRISRRRLIRVGLIAAAFVPPALFLSCTTHLNRSAGATPPVIRARILEHMDSVTVVASDAPMYRTGSDPTAKILNLPKNQPVAITLTPSGWKIGGTTVGTGELIIQPAVEASVTINKMAYRGQYRLVPQQGGKFDVVNDVEVDGYVAGVLAKELLSGWHEEAYKAQAIISRTYVLYEKAGSGQNRHYDVNADQRSQMYGGINGETDKSRRAVNDTMGIVVVYAAQNETPHLIKAYFSSCCGGITQSAADAFNEPFSEPLGDQNNHALCNAAPRFNWGPVVISKTELTRRFRVWGTSKKRAEKEMAIVKDVAIQNTNEWGRPTRFAVTDEKGNHYSLGGEEFRNACNAGVGELLDKSTPAPILYSSFVRVITDVDAIRFVEGHGWGHGVGMCQWCSERRAELGMKAEDIVVAAYQRSKLAKLY